MFVFFYADRQSYCLNIAELCLYIRGNADVADCLKFDLVYNYGGDDSAHEFSRKI